MRESNPRCWIESPASWATRRMRRGASGACRSRCPVFRRRGSRPRAEAFEARRGVEPRSRVLQTLSLPEQRALEQVAGIEPAPSDWQTDARPSSHTCGGADSENRTRSARFGRPALRFEDARGGATRRRRTESNRARSHTERLLHHAQPRSGPARNRTSSDGFGIRSAAMASDPAPRTRIEIVSLDRQSRCNTSRITRQSVLLARIERAGGV
jgi:hypothetical protein